MRAQGPIEPLALALRLDCPIYVDDSVLKNSKMSNAAADKVNNEELRRWLENLNDEDLKRHSKILESDLQSHVKVIAFKLAIMYSESNILEVVNSDVAADDNARVAMYELESTMKRILSKDKKFMQLLKVVQVEFEYGYNELKKLKE